MPTVAIKTADQTSDFEHILNVVRSYSLTGPEWTHVSRSLEQEFDERHRNRELYIASEDIHPVGICQLILNNADNDRDLADGSMVAHVHHLRIREASSPKGLRPPPHGTR